MCACVCVCVCACVCVCVCVCACLWCSYVELDLDIASSAMAANIVRLVAGATKTVTVDMALLNEGVDEASLPEQLLGVLRLNKLDLNQAKKVLF